MAPYIGKKVLKQQRAAAEQQCLRHAPWTSLFFTEPLSVVQYWLHLEQPLWQCFSEEELRQLDEVVLPASRDEIFDEQFRVSYLRETRERAAGNTSVARAAPFTLYERAVHALFAFELYATEPAETKVGRLCATHFLPPRALLCFLSLCAVRERALEGLDRELRQYAGYDAQDVLELERAICGRAWAALRARAPSALRVDEFLRSYDIALFDVQACLRPTEDTPGYEWMLATFLRMLFEEKRYATLAAVPFQELNPAKWAPVNAHVNRHVEVVALEPNTDYYTCRRCGSNRTHVKFVQIRSGDEPATIFVTCVGANCGARWTAKN